jgi:mono/diheme cytochrome c family protein
VGALVERLSATAGAAIAAVALCSCGGTAKSAGERIFDQSCAHCHTLTGHDTTADGGDLALGKLTVADIASFTRVMPVRPPLTAAQTNQVSRYIEATTRERR